MGGDINWKTNLIVDLWFFLELR